MSKERCNISIDHKSFEFDVEGKFYWGKAETLFQMEDNLISKTSWREEGFTIFSLFSADEFDRLTHSITRNIQAALTDQSIPFDANFTLERYHHYVKTDEEHHHVINITRDLTVENLDLNLDHVCTQLASHLGYQLTDWIEELQRSFVIIRINRPNSLDINPPHRDGYLSYWGDTLNMWIPIAGCTEASSLPVLPKSHLFPESELYMTKAKGATINGNTYYVPCILKHRTGNLKMLRPNPKGGEALLFTPFLIHGAAFNANTDMTRISLELRFARKK